MQSDLKPIFYDFPKGENLTIYPVGDVHYGSEEFNLDMWEELIGKVRSNSNAYVMLVGDLIDNGTKSAVTNCFRATATPGQQKKWLAEQLKPISDRILCAVSGNHESRQANVDADDNPLFDVMAKLDLEDRYRENGCFVAIRINQDRKASGKDRPTYTFFVTHGAGGGALIGGGANKTERFASHIEGVDVFVSGHTHKGMTFPVSKLKFDTHNKQIMQQKAYVCVVSSFLNYGGYPIKKMLPPSSQGLTEIILSRQSKHIKITI